MIQHPSVVGIFAAVSIILIFEIGLRVSGFFYFPPDFGVDGTQAPLLNPESVPTKQPGQWRIVVVGESTVGLFGFMGPITEALQPHTKRSVKLINFGFSSYGSARLLKAMPEILSYSPDLIVIYIGHNEFEEPVAAAKPKGFVPWLNEYLIVHLRLYQAVSKAIHGAGESLLQANLEALKKGKRLLPPALKLGSLEIQDKDFVYSQYRKNLLNMIRIARGSGVKVLLSTVAYNRRSIPFLQANEGAWKEANEKYAAGDFAEAKRLLEKAQDEDRAPHHANETVNRIIREIADAERVPLFDADAWIVGEAKHGIPGYDQFTDHCHLELKTWIMGLEKKIGEKILEYGLIPKD